MKKIVWLLLVIVGLPIGVMAQSFDDDLYYTPKSKKTTVEEEKTAPAEDLRAVTPVQTQVVVPSGTTVVIKDRQGNLRDVDEYNRRYTSSDTDFSMEGDTLVVQEKEYADRGEWVNGFDGSEDDYEYAMRIVRFRNPRFAIPVSSPLYWDVLYGVNSWDWNVYDDGFYAYAFPTYTNRLWWDWRFGSFGVTWGFPYYSGYWGWGGYYPGYWGGYWGHHHGWYDPWYGHGHGNWRSTYYNNRRNTYNTANRYNSNRVSTGSYTRPNSGRNSNGSSRSDVQTRPGSTSTDRYARPSSGRVVGTRTPSNTAGSTNVDNSNGTRYERVTGTRQSGNSGSSYTRSGSSSTSRASSSSSSTRRNSTYTPSESSTRRSSSTYSRGSSSSSSRSSSTYNNSGSSRSSYGSSSSRSYSSPSSSYSRSGSSGGSSSRSSGGSSRSGGRR